MRDPWLAGLLAWLVPGAGHFYQGRHFKGTIYSVCILGLFLSGWAMADWSAVQPPDIRRPMAQGTLLLKYGAQLGVGLPTLYGLVQSDRYYSPTNTMAKTIDKPITSEFEGVFFPTSHGINDLLARIRDAEEDMDVYWPLEQSPVYPQVVPAKGKILLEPARSDLGGEYIRASFDGTMNGKPFEYHLGPAQLEHPIRSSGERRVFAEVLDDANQSLGVLVASVPRAWLNRLAVPMSTREVNQLHAKHGNYLEIWMVFTWIGGLLNMLAVWDAVDGPAYGYGDELPQEQAAPDHSKQKETAVASGSQQPQSASA